MIQSIRNNTPKDTLINSIIMLEWEMFQGVNNIGGKASCQRDDGTFYIMRYSQHNTLSQETLRSWREDLREAKKAGRNLMMEKYAYMMEFTDPEYYRNSIAGVLPSLSQEKAQLIAEIITLQLLSFERFEGEYPYLAHAGRDEVSDQDGTSIRTYSVGELKTYSEKTLALYLNDVRENPNHVSDIKKTTVEFYGYVSLDSAEESLRKKA